MTFCAGPRKLLGAAQYRPNEKTAKESLEEECPFKTGSLRQNRVACKKSICHQQQVVV
jgi:hypothetical protein